MFDRYAGGERGVLVHLQIKQGASSCEGEGDCAEFRDLVSSAGVQCVSLVTGIRSTPDPKFFVGAGKAEEVRLAVELNRADVVIFDHTLSPSQERNLERLCGCRVVDRTGLILDIFAQRARSHEGKLQVELAQLRHLSTRLVRGWTHLERQKGGIGLRGPGEKQLETDRRLIAERIRAIEKRLEKVKQQREQGRQSRKKAEVPTVALVGYTNAGKSSLFNALCGADVYAADQLFATLDPTLRRLDLPSRQWVIMADTVGFVRQLPHDLVAAFRATLQETEEADLLLHVIDASDPQKDVYVERVNEVLAQIGAADRPQILVYNKIDLTGHPSHVMPASEGSPPRVWVSARTGEGLDALRRLIGSQFNGEIVRGRLALPVSAGRLRAELFALGCIRGERVNDDGSWLLEVAFQRKVFEQLAARFSELRDRFANAETETRNARGTPLANRRGPSTA